MEKRDEDLASTLQGLLGYLNFSEGRPDARCQQQVNDAFAVLANEGAAEPWQALHVRLRSRLAELKAGGGAFRDSVQVEQIVALVFEQFLPEYRSHHADLLFHQSERTLFQPFFLARVFEAVLTQGGPWDERDRIVRAALRQLNDFVGYRPIAVLESRPKGEPYEHERVRPIPLYLRGAGVACGRYHDLVARAVEIWQSTEPVVLAEAGFDPTLLDELAVDPRAYDHGHPANKRSNYVFGEWDPHHLDGQGRFRRFVVRQVVLDALLERVEQPGDLDPRELLFEAAAVLAGTVLMASGVTGPTPTAHDSLTTLASLLPRIARYRDTFYTQWLKTLTGPHGARLSQEHAATRQHFGAARQHLNHTLARHRALQLQQRHLALLFAEMGHADAGRRQAAQIPTASLRVLSEIQGRLATGQLRADQGKLAEAAALLPEVETLLHRGIDCGALVDPWNVLGFQGLFPLFHAQEDSIRDPRVDDLIGAVGALFNLYSRLLSEAAAAGDQALVQALTPGMRRLAEWWDRYATVEVGDVRHVHGGEATSSAEQVAATLALWHGRGSASADLAFWRQHTDAFHSPKGFALVIEALLRKRDYQASLALLVTWLGQAEQVPLEENGYSFHDLALRWMLGVTGEKGEISGQDRRALARKFFDYLEANAEDYWEVPELQLTGTAAPEKEDEPEGGLFGAAYEDVTFKDSADDDQEGAVADGATLQGDFELEPEAPRLGKRLRFLSTVARLWHVASQAHLSEPKAATVELGQWLAVARENQRRLLKLLDALHACRIPEAIGSYDSLVEYDRRRVLKEQLVYQAIGTCLDTFLAVGTLDGIRRSATGEDLPGADKAGSELMSPRWGPQAGRLEQALIRGDVAQARALLPPFLERFKDEPLLFTALADGGDPRQVLRVRIAQNVLRALATTLPRLGMLRETYHVLKAARAMEQARPAPGRGVTQFNELFQGAYQAVVEAIIEAAPAWGPPGRWGAFAPDRLPLQTPARPLADLLKKLTDAFLKLWVEHSRTLQLSPLEAVRTEREWSELREFIRRYGHDLFHVRFMTLANLRGILHRGVGAYLDYLQDNPDPLRPVRLLEDLDQAIPRARAIAHLEAVLHALVENYDEFKDYNTTTAQSDYGENLYTLLDFLRLKAQYHRYAWHQRPIVLAHEVMVRHDRYDLAVIWREAFTQYNRALAEQLLGSLAQLEKTHGMKLRTVSDLLEERFVKPLDLDRLCALIQPAMEEASKPEQPAFARLEQELNPFLASPTGAGIDVPHWLRRLEHEVQRVWASRSKVAVLAEKYFRLPRQPLTLEDLEQQLRDWEKPLSG